MPVNEAQRKQWSNPEMVANWERREPLLARVSRHVLSAALLQSGEKVLEVGSGGGKLALLAARQVSSRGRVTGADISHGMVELATTRAAAAKAKNVSFVVVDCQADNIPGGPFDVAISQFGVMFFEDPVAAFANIRGHLKRGARLAFACWQPVSRNTWHPGPVVAPFVAASPAPASASADTAPGPFAFGDPGYVRGILQEAGFMGIDRVAKTVTARISRDAVVANALMGAVIPPERLAEAMAAVEEHYAQMRIPETDLYRFELRIQVFTANSQG